MSNIKIKRVYEAFSENDGYRILVDRLWPRGIKKEELIFDKWAKEITPSPEIRKFFNHVPENMDEFKMRYNFELDNNAYIRDIVNLIKEKLKIGNVTLLYAAKDEVYNHAVILKEWLEKALSY